MEDAIKPDLALEQESQTKATGANIHRVKTALGKYRNEIVLGNLKGWTGERKARVQKFETEMRQLLANIPAA
jgi:hypothetical protein